MGDGPGPGLVVDDRVVTAGAAPGAGSPGRGVGEPVDRAWTAAGTAPEPGSWARQVWREGATSVLVVSEAPAWATALVHKLEVEGYAVRVDEAGDAVLEPGCPFDIGVVDLALAGRTPASVCRAFRARTPMPILGVSSQWVAEQTVLAVYAAGADQVAPTADRPSELAARVRALLRRHPPRSRVPDGSWAGSPVQVDLAASRAVVAGQVVPLTRWECEILHRLTQTPGRVVRRSELSGEAGPGRGGQSLDAVVRRVRTKLEAVEGRRRIVAVRGVGFRFLAGERDGDVVADRGGPVER